MMEMSMLGVSTGTVISGIFGNYDLCTFANTLKISSLNLVLFRKL